jgi:hypothetical protein
MAPVDRPGLKGVLCAAIAASVLLGAAPAAHAATAIAVTPGVKGDSAPAGSTVTIFVAVDPPVAGTPVQVKLAVDDKQLFDRQLLLSSSGKFNFPVEVTGCCQYRVTVSSGGLSKSASFDVTVPKRLHRGSRGPAVSLLHSALRDQGYFVRGKKRFTSSTELALLAFRKVNKMHRNTSYSRRIFRTLLQGKGAFPLAHPGDGKHAEADLSRQVLVLAENGAPKYTFPISSGASATPTVTGRFNFYLKTPGYNAKRMYYSAYFIRGYATHGYSPVPNYPASHGCLRNPIPDARFIYNWVDIGDPIWVYH